MPPSDKWVRPVESRALCTGALSMEIAGIAPEEMLP